MKNLKITGSLVCFLFAFVIQLHAQSFLTNGLVAYFPFDGNSIDASGNGNNGTNFGTVTYTADRFGNSNSAIALPGGSGTGSGVDVPSLSNMAYKPATYSAWILVSNYPPNVGEYTAMPIVGRDQCGDQEQGGVIIRNYISGSATNALAYLTGEGGVYTFFTPPTNVWAQVVFTLDASNNGAFYFNGNSVGSTYDTNGSGPGLPLDFRIGASATGGCTGERYVWNGQLDDIRVYNRALSSTEVQELYQYEAPPCDGQEASAVAVVTNGFVVGANLTSEGCGISNTPTVLIEGGGGSGATAYATVTNGMVTGITITATGSGYTNPPTIYIGGTPVIVTQPQSVTAPAFGEAGFTVNAIGTASMNYQWSFNGTNLAGSNDTYLFFTNVVQSNLGTYAVTISNVFGVTNSVGAVLAMPPYLISPFTGLDTDWGYTNTLSVQAWGSGPLTYQWYDNGVAVDGATNASLVYDGIQFTNGGLYTVVVSSSYGSVTNAPAQVVINPAGVAMEINPSVVISGVTGYNYTIQRTDNLGDTNSWVTVANVTLGGPVQFWTDTNINVATGSPQEFYRVLPGQ